MSEQPTGDAERLRLIQELERAIAAEQLNFDAVRTERDKAKEHCAAVHRNVVAIGRQIRDVEAAVHLVARGAYLNGDVLDRGVLTLGNELLRFSGWHGKVAIALKDVRDVGIGTSLLSPRVGVPLLERIWPGRPRPGYTLLVKVNDGTESGAMAVVTDLRDAVKWQEEIRARQQGLEDVARQRADLLATRQQAGVEAQAANTALTVAQAGLRTAQWVVSDLGRLRDGLQAQQRKVDVARRRLRDRLQAQERKADAARQRAAKAQVRAAKKGGKA